MHAFTYEASGDDISSLFSEPGGASPFGAALFLRTMHD